MFSRGAFSADAPPDLEGAAAAATGKLLMPIRTTARPDCLHTFDTLDHVLDATDISLNIVKLRPHA
jgi:hypothetical protein